MTNALTALVKLTTATRWHMLFISCSGLEQIQHGLTLQVRTRAFQYRLEISVIISLHDILCIQLILSLKKSAFILRILNTVIVFIDYHH